MEKKMYYAIDNGDVEIYADTLPECMEIIESEWSDMVKNFRPEDEDAPKWIIFPIWMTENEFKNLPDTP